MSTQVTAVSAVIIAWVIYFIIHSVLASSRFKAWARLRWPSLCACYRLMYNVTALLLLGPVLWLLHQQNDVMLWQWQGGWRWLSHAAALAAIAGFVWSLHYYDLREFIGLRSCIQKTNNVAVLSISPLHRFVRHPWYFFGLLLIWTRDMNDAFLASAVVITAYFVIGSRLEENKLVNEFGEPYRCYRRRVPGLIPLPWRRLDRKTAAELERAAATSHFTAPPNRR